MMLVVQIALGIVWSMTLEQVHGISTFVVWFAATVIPVLIGLNFTTAASA